MTANPILDPLLRQPVVDLKTGIMTRIWSQSYQNVTATAAQANTHYADSHANRAGVDVAQLSNGVTYYETDRDVTYVLLGTAWVYVCGTMLAARTSAPTDLGLADAGFLMYVTDFHHLVMWNGTRWQFGPGDDGSGFFRDFAMMALPSVGWTLCDGSSTSYLAPGVQLYVVPITLPDLTGNPSYRKSGAAYSDTLSTGGGSLTGAGAVDVRHITILPYFRR